MQPVALNKKHDYFEHGSLDAEGTPNGKDVGLKQQATSFLERAPYSAPAAPLERGEGKIVKQVLFFRASQIWLRRNLRCLHEFWVRDALQPVGEELESVALGQQHQQPVESLEEVRIAFHIQQLQTEIWKKGRTGVTSVVIRLELLLCWQKQKWDPEI